MYRKSLLVRGPSCYHPAALKTQPKNLPSQAQPEFNWVIRDCLLSLRDEGWTCQVRSGDLEYCYKYKDETRPYHPIAEAHRKLAERLMASQSAGVLAVG
ncbi:unnamed protein product, partial [Symbiodinium necroappetens]